MKMNLFGTTALVAAALAMATPQAAQAQVSTQFIDAQTGTTYTFVNSDCSKLVTFNNAASVAVTLPAAGTASKFFAGCFIDVQNKGAGIVTITPTTSTINGQTTLVLPQNTGFRIVSDGVNYQIQPGGGITAGGGALCVTSGTTTATCNGTRGIVTINALSAAPSLKQTMTITNSSVLANSIVQCTLGLYSGTLGAQGYPTAINCFPVFSSGTIVLNIANLTTTTLGGQVTVQFSVLN